MILLSSPLKNDPPETTVSIFFSRNQNLSQLKKFEKILSTMNVLKIETFTICSFEVSEV